jgi:predicted lysophospholipase L1 biosynthesis ABC-type transport system permease subunit
MVNERFAAVFFDRQNPVGRSFEKMDRDDKRVRFEIVGYVRDARYRDIKEPIRPTIYVPLGEKANWGTFVVRTASDNPLTLAPFMRLEVPRVRSEFRISNVHTQLELVQNYTIRERLLAMLALFFAVVSLLLAVVGLFGVLDFSVQQRRREIGIRMALGAQGVDVARRVTIEVFAMVLIGACAGLTAGVFSETYLETLLYGVKTTDLTMLALPSITIFSAALLAALPPVIRAVRIDPAKMLRAD